MFVGRNFWKSSLLESEKSEISLSSSNAVTSFQPISLHSGLCMSVVVDLLELVIIHLLKQIQTCFALYDLMLRCCDSQLSQSTKLVKVEIRSLLWCIYNLISCFKHYNFSYQGLSCQYRLEKHYMTQCYAIDIVFLNRASYLIDTVLCPQHQGTVIHIFKYSRECG